MENSEKPTYPFTPPRPWDDESAYGFTGLTKREYFAAMAMQGLLANRTTAHSAEKIITASLAVADELLKQLEKHK